MPPSTSHNSGYAVPLRFTQIALRCAPGGAQPAAHLLLSRFSRRQKNAPIAIATSKRRIHLPLAVIVPNDISNINDRKK
jgi:hypothetical protein